MRNPLTHPVDRPHLRYFETLWEAVPLWLLGMAWDLAVFAVWMLQNLWRWWRWLLAATRRLVVSWLEGLAERFEKARGER